MKKILLVLLVIFSVFAVSCGNEGASAKSDLPTSRLLTDATGIDDKSFNAAAWRGILAFYGDTWENPTKKGKLYDVVTAQTQDMYVPNLKQASDEKYDLIIVTGFTFQDALAEVAPKYPNQKYVIVDVSGINQPNVMEATFSEHEGSYLVGVAAALKAKADNIQNPKFGFIGGVPSSVITKFEMGWVQGIRSIFPNATIVDYYATTGENLSSQRLKPRTGTTPVYTQSSLRPVVLEAVPSTKPRSIAHKAKTSGLSESTLISTKTVSMQKASRRPYLYAQAC